MEYLIDYFFRNSKFVLTLTSFLFAFAMLEIVYSTLVGIRTNRLPKYIFITCLSLVMFGVQYSKMAVENRPKIELSEINKKYVGKMVRVDNSVKKIKNIYYSEVNKLEITYEKDRLTEKVNESTDLLSPFYVGLVIMIFFLLLEIVLLIFRNNSSFLD